jgi:hypothetical protein
VYDFEYAKHKIPPQYSLLWNGKSEQVCIQLETTVRFIFQKKLPSEVRLNSVMPPEIVCIKMKQWNPPVVDYGHHIHVICGINAEDNLGRGSTGFTSFAEYEKRQSHVLQKEKKENLITRA